MCNFKSAIVMRDEREKGGFKLLLSPWTEHHSELEIIFKLKDGARLNYAKVEYTPKDMAEAYKPETYTLNIDEERTPDWFDAEMKEKVSAKLDAYIKSIIVSNDVCLLIGGQFIIAPGAKIESANCMVISAMCGGTLSEMRGGTLSAMCGGTLSEMRGGTLSAMWGGTLSAMCGGTLSEMRGGTLSAMCGGTLSEMWGGTLSAMCGGTLSEMRGGTLSAMCGGTLSEMWGGTLSAMWGGTLSEMRGGTLSEILDTYAPLVGKIYKAAKVVLDNRKESKTK